MLFAKKNIFISYLMYFCTVFKTVNFISFSIFVIPYMVNGIFLVVAKRDQKFLEVLVQSAGISPLVLSLNP